MEKKKCPEPFIEVVMFEGEDVLMGSGFDGVGEYDPDAMWE